MAWIREILEWQREMTNPEEFLEYLKIDLFPEDVFVYTPAGALKQLRKGSTPLDFAFAVHSDVGFHCVGAKINGKFVPLSTVLQSGDEVEIKTSPHQNPSSDWLKIVKTTKAKSKIKYWLKQRGYEQSVVLGKEIFQRELKKRHLKSPPDNELLDFAARNSFTDLDQMFSTIGSGAVSALHLIGKLFPDEEKEEPSLIRRFIDQARGVSRGIKIDSVDNIMFRFAACCQPVPGERIIGFVTRGRGLTIHSVDCKNVADIFDDPERMVKVDWDVEKGQSFLVRLLAVLEDRKNLLKEITEVISEADVNVRGAEIIGNSAPAMGRFVVEIQNYGQLEKALGKIARVKGVMSVEREIGGDRSS